MPKRDAVAGGVLSSRSSVWDFGNDVQQEAFLPRRVICMTTPRFLLRMNLGDKIGNYTVLLYAGKFMPELDPLDCYRTVLIEDL